METPSLSALLLRGLLLRCPRCGKGKLFRRGFKMYEYCPLCHWRYEREEGYWTGAMAVNLVITELLIAFVVVPLAMAQVPMIPLLICAAPMPIVFPLLFYRHSKSFWMSIDLFVHPLSTEPRYPIPPQVIHEHVTFRPHTHATMSGGDDDD